VSLRHAGDVELPPSAGPGGFDHAAIHRATGRLFVAHTANDAVDVVDVAAGRYVGSVGGLPAVAGALAHDGVGLVFTSNRGENTVDLVDPAALRSVAKLPVGVRPNGLALDAGRGRLLVAHVGDPAIAGSHTVAVIDVATRRCLADLAVPGRTRWAVHDPVTATFFVNVMDPPVIVAVASADPVAVRRVLPVPGAGPHGLDIDVAGRRLFCACDGGTAVELHADTGAVLRTVPIGGVPDVVVHDAALGRLYVAIGDPGVIEVIDTAAMRHRETVVTGPRAHTLAWDPERQTVYAFLPATHRAALYVDGR
jgi:DNA-binding beta-propeller fold protein YncE